MAASVSTLVVSWKEAARQEGFRGQGGLRDAQQQPGALRHGQVFAILPLLPRINAGLEGSAGVLILHNIHGGAGQQVRVPGVLHPDLALIWRTITSMCLSLMSTPC